MRPRISPPPTSDELRGLTVHEVVRDYPETLAVFRSRDVSFRTSGPWPLDRFAEESDVERFDSLLRDLRTALEWREGA